ncbi:Plant invertase/pectin methylesterase inhibitor superfamily protein [Raphanus sativus]|uniref:Pectinesterase inhibitor 11 n=1 Tax=Raphanus sativus TaxID=3726 RepID=A0A6J0JXN5_RAPSA|nr:pectinesterase inhibitor 11 [Raphanus sativus]KAJ4888480.1 Plant invertase/pectin methylesterase inhibitor superfamily protein [Raphanus sativus]
MGSKNLTATLLLFTTFLFISRSTSAVHSPPRLNATTNDLTFIRTSCNATLYADLCFNSLAGYASAVQNNPARLAKLAIGVTISKAKSTALFLTKFSHSATKAKDCASYLKDALDEMRDSLRTLRNISRGVGIDSAAPSSVEMFRFKMSDVQTYMSAALTYEDTCTDEYDETDEVGGTKTAVYDRVNNLKRLTSNALALVNSYANNGAP